MDLAERRELLVESVRLLSEARAAWANSDADVVTRAYEEALEDAFAVFRDGALPADCRALAHDVEFLEGHWRRYQDRVLQSGNPKLLPDNGFNAAFDAMEDRARGLSEPERKVLEPIPTLEKQGLNDAQICTVYGWVDPRTDQPQLWKLAEERVQPGKHTGAAAGFLPPAEKARRAQEKAQLDQLARIRAKAREKKERAEAKPPETLAKLVQDGVSLRQIADMLHLSPEETERAIKALNLPVPALDYEPLQTARAPAEPQISPETERAMAAEQANPTRGRKAARAIPAVDAQEKRPLTLEQRIIALHQEGGTPAEIAAAVSSADTEIKPGKVTAIIARWKRDPAAFGG